MDAPAVRHTPLRRIALFAAEHALLALALSFTVPPITSHKDHPYAIEPITLALVFGLVLASRACARQYRETWLGAAVKAVILTAFCFVSYMAR